LDARALLCGLARSGERSSEHFGSAVERVEQIFCWSRRRCESDAVAQIVKIIHFLVRHHDNTPESKAQLYVRTELVQN
jgi:hypothetical protein